MPCVNPDGSLTFAARDVLKSLDRDRNEEEIRATARQPIYRVRSSLREMQTLGWVVKSDGRYTLTEAGRVKMGQLVG